MHAGVEVLARLRVQWQKGEGVRPTASTRTRGGGGVGGWIGQQVAPTRVMGNRALVNPPQARG